MRWQPGQDHDQLLDGFKELDAQRERQLQAEFDVEEVEIDEPVTPYEEQREAMIDAGRGAYYGDLGILP